MSPSSRRAGRAGLLLAGLLVAFGLAEAAGRSWAGLDGAWLLATTPNLYDTGIFQPDAELGQVLRPGAVGRMRTPEFDTSVRVSAQGTRGADVGPKPDGALRVLAVGDSFTLAVQVDEEETFSALLTRRLTASLGRPVEVLSAGVDGFGTFQAARQAARLAPKVQADVVLLVFFLGNDFDDNRSFKPHGYPTHAQSLPSLASPLDRAFSWSYLYSHATVLVRRYVAATDPGRAGRFRAEAAPFVKGTDLASALEPTRRALQEAEARAADLGAPLVVALAPPAFVVSPERARPTFELFDVTGEPDLDAPARALRAALPSRVPLVDLTPTLREAEAKAPTYFVFDAHWTAHGHEAVAAGLAPTLERVLGAGSTP